MKAPLLIGSSLAIAGLVAAAYLPNQSNHRHVVAGTSSLPLPPELTLRERTRAWQTEFFDPGTLPERQGMLLMMLRHGEDSQGGDPRTAKVIAEALTLFDELENPERREDILVGLKGLADESILVKTLALLRDDPDQEVRGDAADLLSEYDDERATAGLKWSQENDVSQRVREDCKEALE